MKARYRISFNDKSFKWEVWDGRSKGVGIVVISQHHTDLEARAAARRYEAADKRRAAKPTGDA